MGGVLGRLGLAALSCVGLGCAPSQYACVDDAQCPNGVCEPTGYCAFDDADCASGRRYGSFAGGGLAGACVQVMDGTSSGGPVTTSGAEVTTSLATTNEPSTSGDTPNTSTEGSTTSGSEPSSSAGEGETTTSTGGTAERVEDGLLVLYRFDEGQGTTIHDTSAVEPPIDLVVVGAGYEWEPGALRFTAEAATVAHSTTSVTKLNTACQAADEITLEAWITPHDLSLQGPPRILSYSSSAVERNFSLLAGVNVEGTDDPAFRGRLRVGDATSDDLNGVPELVAPTGEATTDALAHVVFVHDMTGAEQVYVDGAVVAEGERPGSFAAWNTSGAMVLVLGNELDGSRAADATLHLAAVYCRALGPDEVLQNLEAGPST